MGVVLSGQYLIELLAPYTSVAGFLSISSDIKYAQMLINLPLTETSNKVQQCINLFSSKITQFKNLHQSNLILLENRRYEYKLYMKHIRNKKPIPFNGLTDYDQ